MIPPQPDHLSKPSETWKLKAGIIEDAACADIIVLASPFHVMWDTLKPIVPLVKGKSKIFLEMTNP